MTRNVASSLSRRRFLQAASIVGALPPTIPVWADAFVNLDLPGGPDQRSITGPTSRKKGRMILQRSRPPLLETPFDVCVWTAASLRPTINSSYAGTGLSFQQKWT